MTPTETLVLIEHRLKGQSLSHIIETLLPRETPITWARRLSGWDEYPFPAQVKAIARIISQRAMKENGLRLTEDGRVVSRDAKVRMDPKPERTFTLAIADEQLTVEYTSDYYPGKDLLSFVSPKPHCLSETGHLSQFVPRDIVDACGGPEAFAALYAEAKVQGTDKELMAVFEGRSPDPKRRKPSRGNHSARVVGEPESSVTPVEQRTLF
jgi:hypothetical protein